MVHDSKRIEWVDVLKGIGIILVVVGHSTSNKYILQYIFSFHMPLFFFISGYLFDSSKYKNFRYFIKRKMNSLIKPYLIFAVITYIMWIVNILIRSKFISMTNNPNKSFDLIKPIFGTIYSIGINGNLDLYNTPIWFMTCLFITEIILYFVVKFSKTRNILILITILCGIIGYLLSGYFHIVLPWSIDLTFTALVFCNAGFLFSKEKLFDKVQGKKFIVVITAILSIILCYLNGKVDMNTRVFNNYIYFYISAFSGIFLFRSVSEILMNNSFLSYIGSKSIYIMAFHLPLFYYFDGVKYFISKKIYHINAPDNGILIATIYSIVSITIILFVLRILEKLRLKSIKQNLTISL